MNSGDGSNENDLIASNAIQNHIRQERKDILVFSGIFLLLIIACLPPLIVFSINAEREQSWNANLVATVICMGAIILVFLIMCVFISFRVVYLHRLKKKSKQCRPIVWRLDGDQWTTYVDHVFGGEHAGYTLGFSCFTCSWCCRRRRFNQLSTRQYGYIILYPFCIIVDQILLIDSESKLENSISIINLNQQQTAIRIGLVRSDGDGGIVKGHLDLFVPRQFQEPYSRLQQMTILWNTSTGKTWESQAARNFEQMRTLFENTSI